MQSSASPKRIRLRARATSAANASSVQPDVAGGATAGAGSRRNPAAFIRRALAATVVRRIAEVLRARGTERLEVTANPHAMGFYRAAGFIDCGVAETALGTAPRMVLALP